MNLKFIEQVGHQGDVQVFKCTGSVNGLKKLKKTFIARSERSGSVHALCGNYDMYETDGGVLVVPKEDLVLNHTFENNVGETEINTAKVLPKKDHRHSILPKLEGQEIYFIGIQEKIDPLSGLRKKVVD